MLVKDLTHYSSSAGLSQQSIATNGVFVQTNAASDQRDPATAGLVFRRYGSTYFLGEIWVGHRAGELPESEIETRVAKQWQKDPANTTVLALNKK